MVSFIAEMYHKVCHI